MTARIAGLVVSAALAAAVLAGCGGTSDRAAQDRRSAAIARIAAEDLPGRWVPTPNGGTLNCPALAGALGAARSASDQLLSEGGSADDVVLLFPNALAAKVQMQAILSAAGRRCIGREMWDHAPAAVPSATLAVHPVGDDVQAARFTLPAGADELGILDVVVVRIGRGVVVVEVASDAPRLDAGLRDGVVAVSVRKLRAALDG
jgi:hypothetical protein